MKFCAGLAVAVAVAVAVGCGVMVGCSSQPKNISANALIVGGGYGPVTYYATQPGTVTIYDKTWNKLLYTGQVEPNQNVRVDTELNRITIGSKTVVQRDMGNWDQYRIYFEPSRAPMARE